MFKILKVTVGPKKLTARVLVNPGMPLMTSEDVEATARVYYLAPAIAEHMCLGDAGSKFQDCMGHTELAHLLEHLTVEIMNETGLAGGISSGRTRGVMGDDRLFDVEISCPDDALAVGALSSASFMMNWAYLHADQTPPDFPGTVAALASWLAACAGRPLQAMRPVLARVPRRTAPSAGPRISARSIPRALPLSRMMTSRAPSSVALPPSSKASHRVSARHRRRAAMSLEDMNDSAGR